MRLLDVPAEKNPRTKTTKKPAGKSAAPNPATAKANPAAAKAKPTAVKAKPAAAKKEAKPARTPKRGGGTLVIVESPAKASTIKKYLGAGFEVKASVGHVKDLPKATIGIDIEHDFQPEYVVIDSKRSEEHT